MLLVNDFETITDENDCRIWAWASCDINNIDYFEYGNSMDSYFEYLKNNIGSTIYFHNLKFDGEFIMVYLFEHGFKHVINKDEETNNTFTTLISDKGQFYSIKIIFNVHGKKKETITFYDSLKILPFKVSEIAKAFNLPISKLEIDYKQYREIGHELTQEEIEYIRNDCDICARALNTLFSQNLTKMTQGSNALFDYTNTIGKKNFERWFPKLEYFLDKDIRQAYKGGFTYLNDDYKNKDIGEGLVFDVNSLYPYVMHEKILPYGEPIYFTGKYKEDKLYTLYVQMFSCQFELKDGFIPTLQLKNNLSFIPTQYLKSSNGEEVTLCLTSVDIELFFKHYNVYNVEYKSGWKFKGCKGKLFNDYIDKWTKVKIESGKNGNKGMRTLAKLMLNALYGKFGLNPDVRSKIPFYSDGMVKYTYGDKEIRDSLYIPVAVFVTSWARYITITNAQILKKYFVYADTDSLHLNIKVPDKIKNMSNDEIQKLTTKDLKDFGLELPDEFKVDGFELGAWKLENVFYRARFIRQKCYIEDSNKPYKWYSKSYDNKLFKITCAGMPESCYDQVTWNNFKIGKSYSGKLLLKHVVGGIILKDTDFTIKN